MINAHQIDTQEDIDIRKRETGSLYGEDWRKAVGLGPDARHDIPALMMNRLLRLNNNMHTHFNTHIEKQFSISFGEFRVLMSLGRMVQAASHEIAKGTGISTMTISRAVASLSKKGYLTAETDPYNKRRKILQLTESGQKQFELLSPTAEDVAQYMVEDLEPDEIIIFSELVSKLANKLEAVDSSGNSVFLQKTKPRVPSKA